MWLLLQEETGITSNFNIAERTRSKQGAESLWTNGQILCSAPF